VRLVLLTGEFDQNRVNTRIVFERGFQAEGFKHVRYVEVPGLQHAIPNAEHLAKAIRILDEGKMLKNRGEEKGEGRDPNS
jgi:hypothetical protein